MGKITFVPNEEIRQELTTVVECNKWNEFVEFQKQSEELLNATLDMDCSKVAEQIEKIHTEYVSAIHYNNVRIISRKGRLQEWMQC